ncbi:MAG: hypothetical protein HDQ88_10505 [Clostridia bacterium]|nr:hypothetical protein [Clostridia bacterium]
MEDNQEFYSSCTNCKYFVQHYRKDGMYYKKVNCGHCLNFRLKMDMRKSFPFINGCEKWEEDVTTSQNYEEVIANAVNYMASSLPAIQIFIHDYITKK